MTTTHNSKQERFFMAVGDPVDIHTVPQPEPSKAEQTERGERAKALASRYRTELSI